MTFKMEYIYITGPQDAINVPIQGCIVCFCSMTDMTSRVSPPPPCSSLSALLTHSLAHTSTSSKQYQTFISTPLPQYQTFIPTLLQQRVSSASSPWSSSAEADSRCHGNRCWNKSVTSHWYSYNSQ